MKGLVADANCQGHLGILVGWFLSKTWREIWHHLQLSVETFASLGLAPTASDREVWRVCQARGIVLITRNRNRKGPDSLQAAIETLNQPDSLPVVTLADADRLPVDRRYAGRTAERLLEFLLDMDNHRGAGRLYIP